MNSGPTTRLAAHTAGIHLADLPEAVVVRSKEIIADALACAIAGTVLSPEITVPLAAYARAVAAPGPCSVIIDGGATVQPLAALLNAVAIHSIDYDDTHMGAVAHLGASVVPSALATVEARNGTGAELIEAVVAGFEAGGKVGRAVARSHYQRFHATSSIGGIASAAAAARGMGLDTQSAEIAIGLAADDAGGTRYCIKVGDFSKSLHAGNAAWKGTQGAALAALGAQGPLGLLEHEVGFLWAYTDDRDVARLERELEDLAAGRWEIMEVDLKAHPCILSSHTAIEGAQIIGTTHRLAIDDITEIILHQPAFSDRHGLNYTPDGVMAARLSVPYCVVIGLLDGRVGMAQFAGRRYLDPVIRRHMAKVTIAPDDELRDRYPGAAPTRVEIHTKAGQRFEQEVGHARGSHARPLVPADFDAKQQELLGTRLSDEDIARWQQVFADLELLPDLRQVSRLLRVGVSA